MTFRRILALDEAALVRISSIQLPPVTRVMRTLTRIGDGPVWGLLGLGLLLSGGAAFAVGARLAWGALIATVLVQIAKRSLRRPRPNSGGIKGFQALDENPDAFSFPSGHTASAFAVAMAFAGAGIGAGPLVVTLALGIAFSRVYLGAHYVLDVAAGAFIGLSSGLLARWLGA